MYIYALITLMGLLNGSGDAVIYRFQLIQRTAARSLTEGEYHCNLIMTLHWLPGGCGILDLLSAPKAYLEGSNIF